MGKAKVELPTGKLWPATPSGAALNIEVFGATGEWKSGKSLLGLSIAPGAHPEGHPFAGQPRTLYLDFEKSGGTYGGTGCKRVDVPTRMLDVYAGKSYTPLDVFTWFADEIDRLKPGQFDVIMADPITDIESGLVEYVKKNCEKFGLSRNQADKGGGMIWGAIKDYWKQVLLKLSAKCQCFYFTSHLRDEWSGNQTTGRREPKGKETLMELASLYLWLERKPEADGRVPALPSGIVLKERLADTSINDDGTLEITQLMPPRLPQATVGAIRTYICSPPDYGRLKDGERVPEETFTEEKKLRLEVARAEAERDTETTRLSRLQRMAELQGQQRLAEQKAEAEASANPDKTAEIQAAKEAAKKAEQEAKRNAEQAEIDRLRAKADAEIAKAQIEGDRLKLGAGKDAMKKATQGQVEEVIALVKALGIDAHKLKEIVVRAGVEKVSEMPFELCGKLLDRLRAEKAKRAPAKN